jgi:ABC-type lipoprotein export system ATPase subunit/ABC-type antimicrobial peptide transport system permease subunit
MELIRVENLTKTYHLGEIDVPVLNGVSFSIQRGELVALMGASGSGKTTLMNILGCLDRPSSGEYWLDGQEMSGLSPNQRALVRTAKLGFVFQSFNLLARTTAVNNVTMPLDYSPTRPAHHAAHERAVELLNRVGLSQRLDHEPSQMSGGQQQRVAIARALINQPALVLADEPTGNLDSHTSVEILQMFQKLNAAGITVILVTHDPKVASFAGRTIRIADGLIESDGPSQPLLAGPHAGFHSHMGSDSNGNGSGLSHLPSALAGEANGNGHIHGNGDSGGNGDDGATWRQPQLVGAAAAQTSVAASGAVATAPSMRAHNQPQTAQPSTQLGIASEPIALATAAPEPQAHKHAGGALWSLLPPTLRTALGALRRNKMRSALTTLGIIIGVGAVIAMVEIGQGSKSAIQQTIASMGANTLLVQSGAATSGGVSFGVGSVLTLTPQDSDDIARQCPSVAAVAPIVRARAQIIYGGRNWVPMNIFGSTPDYLVTREWEDMDDGEMFTDHDVTSSNRVCVVGETIVRELFLGQSPVGKDIRVQNVSLRVVGVLSRKGANTFGMDQDDIVLAPWTTIKYRVAGTSAQNANQSAAAAASSTSGTSTQVNTLNNLYPGSLALYPALSATQMADTPQPVRFTNVDQIMVKAGSATEIPKAIDEITELLRARHRLRPDQAEDFNIRDMTEITKAMTSTSDLMSMLLLIVAFISLFVGGVGIMNIMLVSVTERTREIGLRMAVGARSHHILRQFLIEAVVLCLLGGAVGILLGRGASFLVRAVVHWPTQISVPAIIAAFAVSVTVGVIFGFYPAWKASRLDPIEALRYE